MSFKIQPPTELPQNLLDEYTVVEKRFIDALQIMDPALIENSYNHWNKLYHKILNTQPDGVRYHKGGEVHNMGACKIYTHQALESFHFFMMGYIEDLLSLPLETANNTPGAKTLRELFKLSEEEFKMIRECVEEVVSKKGIVQNPKDVLDSILNLRAYDELERKAKKVTLLVRYGRYSSISHLPEEWEKRVFIGGDYESVYLLDAIISPVREFGFTPIIAAEFKTAPENIHHDALLLLHNCKYAIFDVSSKGGHMMEVERTLEYETKTLFVCNKNEQTRVSAMLKSMGKDYDIHWFENRWELKTHIYNFLQPPDVLPSKPPEEDE